MIRTRSERVKVLSLAVFFLLAGCMADRPAAQPWPDSESEPSTQIVFDVGTWVDTSAWADTKSADDSAVPDAFSPLEDTTLPNDTAGTKDGAVAEDTSEPPDTVLPSDTNQPEDTGALADTVTVADTFVPEDTSSPEDTNPPADTSLPDVPACEGPTCKGIPAPEWALLDFQPQSPKFGETYGLEVFQGSVTLAVLLAGW